QIDMMGHTSRYAYDGQGNLIMFTNAEGESQHIVYNEKGLRTAVIDPLGNRTHFRYNAQHQLVETEDCSGNRTAFRYNEWGQLTGITDAEGDHTTYCYDERHQPVQVTYADGSTAHFHYDFAGRLTTYTDSKGNSTYYRYSLDDLPIERTNALNHRFQYEYDKARRLITLTNENQAGYHFEYDDMNRLTAEVGFDKGKTTYHYNEQGELTTQAYWGNNSSPKALREIHFKRDGLGRIVQESIAQQDGLSAQTDYQYDGLGRITQLSDGENTQGFDYDKVGRLVQQRQYRLNANGMVESQALHHHYDKNGNRTKLTLPNKDEIHALYYGSGHLSAIKYNDSLITEISRGKLHQELTRTQGKLTTQFKRDPLGRLAQQLAALEGSHTPLVQRAYEYDLVGNLIQTQDKRFGTTNYRYDKLGQIQLAGQELFQFDPAHNIIERESERIQNNQVIAYQGITYRYDEFGNLSQRTFPNGEVQSYRYNAKDKLVEVAIQKPNQAIETWQYQYDVLGRRISKVRSENGEILANTQKQFIWNGSHLVQEIDHKTNRTYRYIYSHPNSYEPLAQLVFVKNSKNPTACYYYHNDQIGIPRELTDEDGKLCWYANYSGWGKIKEEYDLTEDKSIHQPFRLQNQYCDSETGLHYNFFRYYEPNIGRFTQLDPIGLLGGENLYRFADNVQGWIDPFGLEVAAVYDRMTQTLKIKDLDTQRTIEGPFKTGANIVSSETTFSGPIPAGKYHILERQGNNDFFRLEPVDSNYGDDTHDATGRNEFRLHKPGRSIGCITSLDKENWEATNSFIRNTEKTITQVNSKSRNPFKWGQKESIIKYGELTVN
ncbi:RHS repeat-associated core domain-containing protein, partial [Glaesserella parasuis]